MRLWLEKAGVFGTGWQVNEAQYEKVAGIGSAEIEVLAQFTPEQRAYLKTLANIGEPGPFESNDIGRMAAATYGFPYMEKAADRLVIDPLERAGFITVARRGRAKPSSLSPTERLEKDLILPLLEQLDQQVGSDLRSLLRQPLSEILKDLAAEDKHTRGLALEALAFKLMRLIDLRYVATRLRGDDTGGAEVDVIFESTRLVFSRWQIQCKNVARGVSLDDVAKEVGLTHFLKSNVIVIVSTGEIGPAARRYANKVMEDSNLCVIMIDRADVQAIAQNPTAIVDVLNRQAEHAMKLKVLQL